MKTTRILMGMPITVEVLDSNDESLVESVFAYFTHVDEVFSTYKDTSEISAINAGRLRPEEASVEMQTIFAMAEQTRQETDGYFNIWRGDRYDPAGIVKGWAIANAADILRLAGCANFYVDAGGDIEAAGHNDEGLPWRVGIRNPFDIRQIVKVLEISGCGVATSGTYIRGQHVYDPYAPGRPIDEILSLTVVGPNVYEADRFATAAFAMGRRGILFIEQLAGFEGYLIDAGGQATLTTGFGRYVLS
ncbi:FAD:protein FMN transferase [Chloroflexales bacterium ZM16-3]|nr:FAD:protein FMN transferase [Chloroflexales bacterium ZM16-3]